MTREEPPLRTVVVADGMVFQRLGPKPHVQVADHEWFTPGNRMAFSWTEHLVGLDPVIVWQPTPTVISDTFDEPATPPQGWPDKPGEWGIGQGPHDDLRVWCERCTCLRAPGECDHIAPM